MISYLVTGFLGLSLLSISPFFIPCKTISIHGYLGSGKNALLTLLLYAYQLEGRHPWANYDLIRDYFPDYTHIQTLPESDTVNWSYVSIDYMYRIALLGLPLPYKRNVVGFDEFQYLADSRNHQDKSQEIMSYLEIQGRKRHTIYIYISKRSKLVDVRMRDRDIAYSCEKHHYKTNEICYEDECWLPDGYDYPPDWYIWNGEVEKYYRPHWYRYDKLDLRNNIGKTINMGFEKMKPFFSMYDTEELLAPVSGYKESDVQAMIKQFDTGGEV